MNYEFKEREIFYSMKDENEKSFDFESLQINHCFEDKVDIKILKGRKIEEKGEREQKGKAHQKTEDKAHKKKKIKRISTELESLEILQPSPKDRVHKLSEKRALVFRVF